MKESEDFRVREITFVKDIFKKLIYALEQTEIQKSMLQQQNNAAFDRINSPQVKTRVGTADISETS
jgi:asparagine synthetase A